MKEPENESEVVLRIRRKMQEEEARRMKKWGIIWLCVMVVVTVAFLIGSFPEKWWQWGMMVGWIAVPVLHIVNSRRLLKGKKPL